MHPPRLFSTGDDRDLTAEDVGLLEEGFHSAVQAIRRNMTPKGFSACSLDDNHVTGTDANYRSVWARDGAQTVIWTLELADEDIRSCQLQTLRTILENQAPAGQLPAHVLIDTGHPEYGGVGGISSIDGAMWMIIAAWRFCHHYQQWELLDEWAEILQRTMDWLSAHDSNNCGLLEIPEAGDWTDLFARSYHVLYDEVLWHRALICYAHILRRQGNDAQAEDYLKWAHHVGRTILRKFWPTTGITDESPGHSFADVQYALGDARYLVAQISPFGYSWRCDVYGNLLAGMTNLIDRPRALMMFRFLWGVGVNDPGPVKNLYPAVQAGDPEWRNYFTVNLLNLPNHYHNGGIWPFIGGLWVRFLHKFGMGTIARRELVNLALLCRRGIVHEWEFNEWHHGVTGRPMGKMFQAWSAASFLKACHDLHVDPDSLHSE